MLEKERLQSTFDKLEMSYLLHGGKENYEKLMKIQKVVSEDPIMKYNPEIIGVHRKEIMVAHAKKLIKFHENF